LEIIREFFPGDFQFQFSRKVFNIASICLDKFQISPNFRVNLGYPKNGKIFTLSHMGMADMLNTNSCTNQGLRPGGSTLQIDRRIKKKLGFTFHN